MDNFPLILQKLANLRHKKYGFFEYILKIRINFSISILYGRIIFNHQTLIKLGEYAKKRQLIKVAIILFFKLEIKTLKKKLFY